MADYERLYGPRVTYSVLYDALDLFFREGGSEAFISRVVGPAATNAFKNLNDNAAAISLVASALGPSTTSSGIKVGVRAGSVGGTYVIFVQDAGNNEVETSGDLATQGAAVEWARYSNYIRLSVGASLLNPAVAAAAALAGGTDDRAAVTNTQWTNALAAFTKDFGGGQISAPGQTTDPIHLSVLAQAYLSVKTAILDAPDSATPATLLTSAASKRVGNQRFGAMFAPWIVAPGYLPGTTRIIPPSALIAGLLSRNEANGWGPSTPAAGDLGGSLFATELSQANWTDAQRKQLNDGSVNVIRRLFGGIRNYGWRSLVDPNADVSWRNFGHARLYCSISQDGNNIAEGYVFDKIDGRGSTISSFNAALKGMLNSYYGLNELYGETAAEAFYVDTGSGVNTPTTIANDELHAVLNVKMSPFAEMVAIEIVKRPITEGVI